MLLKIRVLGRIFFFNNLICLKYFIKAERVYQHFSVCHVVSQLVAPSFSLANSLISNDVLSAARKRYKNTFGKVKALLHRAIGFLSNLSRNAVARQVAGELQCNMGCLAIFLLRKALHEVEFGSTFRNVLQQFTTPLHSVLPLQQLVWQFLWQF